MRKVIRTVSLIILAVIILLGIIGAIFFSRMAASMGVGNAEVADYDKRVEIWEHPAGYSTERKIDRMNANVMVPGTVTILLQVHIIFFFSSQLLLITRISSFHNRKQKQSEWQLAIEITPINESEVSL